MNKDKEKKYTTRRYMMATTAIHQLGDISSNHPDLCVINREEENDYIGMWVFGLGFLDVKFPKEATRPLTEEEKKKYIGGLIAINNNPPHYQFKKEDFEWDEEDEKINVFVCYDKYLVETDKKRRRKDNNGEIIVPEHTKSIDE